jgi:hypothetical protein
MFCEYCKTGNFQREEMFVDQTNKLFVGPCCTAKVPALAPVQAIQPQEDLEYGVEVSNRRGVKAYANFGGLRLSFQRSPEQIRDWAEKNGFTDQKA